MCSVGLAQPDLPGGDALGARSRQTRASTDAIQRPGADDNLHGRGDSNPRGGVDPPGGFQDLFTSGFRRPRAIARCLPIRTYSSPLQVVAEGELA